MLRINGILCGEAAAELPAAAAAMLGALCA